MKKLFLLLTAISTVGFAGNTLTVETGINGDATKNTSSTKAEEKVVNVPVSVKFAHSQDGFSASLKASNKAEFLWAETKNKFDFKDTKLEATLGYESEKFSRTTWSFELAPSTKLKADSFAFSGNTGFKHDFGVLQLGEKLSYEYGDDNKLSAKVTLDAPVKEHKVSSYLEGAYSFKKEAFDLNAKVGATIKHDLFTYSPYVETKNTLKKADGTLDSSETTFEVGAFSLSPKGVDVDTTLNFVLKQDKSVSLNSSVGAKYKYAFNDKVSLTPSVKVELKSELKKNGTVNLNPSLGLAVNQKVNDKLGLDYKLEANLGSEFKYDSAYKSKLNKAELKAGFTVKYNF